MGSPGAGRARILFRVAACTVLAGCGAPLPDPVAPPAPDPAPATELPAYLNPDLPVEARVEDLLGRMTLEEKVGQTLYTAPAIERLGVPAYNWWNEALHGVARAGVATVFPQAIGVAATWDTALIHRVATAISDEARAKHNEWLRRGRRGIYEGLTFWSPNINIFRDPRWGRGMETYGEDPFLTGRMGVAFVRGMQGDDPVYLKTVATPKHYAVHSGPEPDRHTFDARVGEPDLHDTYLAAFRATVVEGGAWSVMCAYNAFRGHPACASHELLGGFLREAWGFGGYVVSDCWAIMDIYNTHRVVPTQAEAAALSLEAGTDLNCGVSFGSLVEAVERGLTEEAAVDVAVRRLLTARMRLGMFDAPERVPWSGLPYSVNDSPEHKALALEAARKSVVLLKNEGGLLPLRKGLGTVAVIGPNADDEEVLLGNYNGFPSDAVTPLRGIREKVGPGTRVLYARGAPHAEELPALVPIPASALRPAASPSGQAGPDAGLRVEYFANTSLEGTPHAVRTDAGVDVRWWGDAPLDGLLPGRFSVRWTGTLVPPVTGRFAVGGKGLGDFKVWVDDELVGEFSSEHEINTRWTDLEMDAGVPRAVRVEYRPRREDGALQLVWAPPESGLETEAVRVAREADAVVLVLGLSPRLEGEEMRVDVPGFAGGDRVDLGLPAAQQRLMEAVVATGKPVVLVLLNGSALGLEWAARNVPAIVEGWYPGQAGGAALAEVLFGDVNPAGRLPLTFYASADDLPPFDDYDMEGRTYRFYRGQPVFPFGHGLSYTTFAYRDLALPARVRAGDEASVSVTVENTGAVAGEEVVQLYVTGPAPGWPRPLRALQGFARVSLRPGESRRVTFTLDARALSFVDDAGVRSVAPGAFGVSVGGGQPGTGAPGLEGRLEVAGEAVRLAR